MRRALLVSSSDAPGASGRAESVVSHSSTNTKSIANLSTPVDGPSLSFRRNSTPLTMPAERLKLPENRQDLLAHIAWLSDEINHVSQEKVNLALATYDSVRWSQARLLVLMGSPTGVAGGTTHSHSGPGHQGTESIHCQGCFASCHSSSRACRSSVARAAHPSRTQRRRRRPFARFSYPATTSRPRNQSIEIKKEGKEPRGCCRRTCPTHDHSSGHPGKRRALLLLRSAIFW